MDDKTVEIITGINQSLGYLKGKVEDLVKDMSKVKGKIYNGMSTQINETATKVELILNREKIEEEVEKKKEHKKEISWNKKTAIKTVFITLFVGVPGIYNMTIDIMEKIT